MRAKAGKGETALVWGYRPDIYLFSGLPAGTQFLDSQALTGVLADRHLTESRPTFPDLAAVNRGRLVELRPTFIVDGLGPLNPTLAIGKYPDLQEWLSQYEVVAETAMTTVYRIRDLP
jgi:hypothetical protein